MDEDILSLLEYKMPTFSKGQKRIAALISEAYDKTAFMTASKLGKEAGVSESTVVRFAMELGYEGYPEMQKAMQETVMNRLTTAQRIGFAQERIGQGDVLTTILLSDAENVRKTAENVDRDSFQRAVSCIRNAKNIYVIGMRSASALASFFGYYLKFMYDSVHIITKGSAGEVLEQLLHIRPGDCVIAFSFPRYSQVTLEAVSYSRNTGATVIGITNSQIAPLSEDCDEVLVAQSDMVSVVDSLTAPMSLVNALIASLASVNEESLRNRYEKLEKLWETHHIYRQKDDTI